MEQQTVTLPVPEFWTPEAQAPTGRRTMVLIAAAAVTVLFGLLALWIVTLDFRATAMIGSSEMEVVINDAHARIDSLQREFGRVRLITLLLAASACVIAGFSVWVSILEERSAQDKLVLQRQLAAACFEVQRGRAFTYFIPTPSNGNGQAAQPAQPARPAAADPAAAAPGYRYAAAPATVPTTTPAAQDAGDTTPVDVGGFPAGVGG